VLGLNPPLGHAVHIVQHEPVEKPISLTDRIHAMVDRLAARPKTDDPDDPNALH
jgi:hypothetical protein